MEQHHRQIRVLLARVRARWRRLMAFQAAVRAALAVSGVLAVALFLTYWTTRAPIALAAIGVVALALAAGVLIWGLWLARDVPSDARVARFIEENVPSLDDRLASAVDLAASKGQDASPALAGPMVADAAGRASAIDPAVVVPGKTLRRAGFQAAAAVLLLATVAFFGRDTASRSLDAVSLALFPSRVTLEVAPGNTRIKAGDPLTIQARLLGNRAPVVAQVLRAEGAEAVAAAAGDADLAWRRTEMATDPSGTFTLGLGPIAASFKYQVVAGGVTSPLYEVTVARAPRVTRIDVEHLYPPKAGLAPHVEEDSGDIYAPAGTEVRLRIHTDREALTGQLALGGGKTIGLTPQETTVLIGTLKVVEDDSYRIALVDREGLTNPGEIEYFIRTLEDRPPEVRILRPARDRSVTRLDEVDIEAEAEDDFGIDRLDLVYAVRGGAERVVPLAVPRQSTSVTGKQTLYLEDLDVQLGDFVSYYVRARDTARGKRSSESRSDIFFLDVKSFEQEFTLVQSQAMGGTSNRSVDDLVTAQKEIIVATWKLDRRAQAANGARSEQDIRAVARAEAELKTRVEETSSSFRGSTMRDPRRSQPGRGGVQPRPGAGPPPPDAPRAGQTLSEEDAMTAAATAMGRAVQSLNALKTAQALSPEMDALKHLLKAQADVKKREVTRQQAPGNAGSNRTTQDMSRLFDKELQRQQQTSYETPTSTEQPRDQTQSMLDKIKDLARRQDALLREQQDLAREREKMTAEELKRELERLTREQSQLRQRAEELAKQAAGERKQGQSSGQQNQPGGQSGQKPGGQQSQNGRGSTGGDASQQMRAISEEMRNAAGDLRREDPGQASARGSRALEQLRELQRQLQAATPDERRRALGEMQLEARQLADAQRQVASERGKTGSGEAGQDGLRRLAAEQERLADRARRLQQGLGQQAAAEAAKEIERQRIPERMRQSAEQLRSAAEQANPSAEPNGAKSAVAAQEEIARALDKVADTLSAADGPRDGESGKLTDRLSRAQALREQIEGLTREVEKLGGQEASSPGNPSAQTGQGQGQAGGRPGSEAARLRDEYNRRLQEARKLLDEMRRDDAQFSPGGMGFTFEGQGMVLSAPGTEAFKQDFTKWEELRKQVTQALNRAESSLAQKLQARESRDRLAAGVDDKAPADYEQRVDSYFKALAAPKKP